jgi:RNA recognition motif-containing protein
LCDFPIPPQLNLCRNASNVFLLPSTDKPNEDPNIRGDAFKTMIVARLSYEADERDLEREFGRFGPIERV